MAVPSLFVGIGASAGGLEAIEAFVEQLQDRDNIAYIVVQHLSPDYKSMMVELLTKKTCLSVHRAEEGMKVMANAIYLIPPKKNLLISKGCLSLIEQDHSRGVNLPIDVFLRSLAEDQGEHSLGVILSGTGSDGMRGVRAIKEHGGVVMVQSEETAKFDGMPRAALSTGLADFVLAPDEMPEQIRNLSKGTLYKADQETKLFTDEDGIARIFSLLRGKTKVDFTYYKPSTVIRRIERRMSINQVHELRDYVLLLENQPAEIMALYRDLLIGVTNFFRDKEAFEELSEVWLPKLLERAHSGELRAWVAGCSTGEEAYSLAIALHEAKAKTNSPVQIKIFATDIDQEAIVKASSGVFTESIAADLSPTLLSKYFIVKSDSYQIVPHIREMIVFAHHNLVKDAPFTNIDFVSCRNLMIYLQPVLQRKVLDFFNFSLNQGGVLLLGGSESLGEAVDAFEVLSQKNKIFRSQGKKKIVGISSNSETRNEQSGVPTNRPSRGYYSTSHREEQVLIELINSLARKKESHVLLINQELEVLFNLGDNAGDILQVPSGKIESHLSKMLVRPLLIPVNTGLISVFKNGDPVTYRNIRLEVPGQDPRYYRAEIDLLQLRRNVEPLAMVTLSSEVDTLERTGEVTHFNLDEAAEQRIMDLEQELQFNRENLQATIEELETSNEELQATNEELLASNEELQSTNEELQSVNEELYTVNAEHQRKIVELSELNNDVNNLLTSTQIATLFLDAELAIRKFTPPITEVYRIIETDLGRPLGHINSNLVDCDPSHLAQEVIRTNQPIQKEVKTLEGKWFQMRVLPYRINQQTFDGVVLSFVDIDSTKRNLESLRVAEERSQMAHMAAQLGSWSFDLELDRFHFADSLLPLFSSLGRSDMSLGDFLGRVVDTDQAKVRSALEGSITAERPFTVEYRLHDDEAPQWISMSGRVFATDEGKHQQIYGVLRNITTEKTTQLTLARREAQYRALFANMADAIGVFQQLPLEAKVPEDFELIETNPAFNHLFGRGEPTVGKRLKQLSLTEKERSILWDHMLTVIHHAKGHRFEFYIDSLGKWFNLLAYQPVPELVAVIMQDVTVEHESVESLTLSEARFRSVFEDAVHGFCLVSPEGHFLKANRAMCEMTGYKEDELLRLKFQDITHPDDLELDVQQAHQLLSGEIESYNMHKRYLKKDGSHLWGHLAVSLVKDEEDRPLYFLAQVLNINEQKEAEAQLTAAKEQAEIANRTKSHFLANISHDIRTPLNAILGFSDILLREEHSEAQVKPFELIRKSGRSLLALIDDILDLSKVEAGKLQMHYGPVDLSALVLELSDYFGPTAKGKGLEFDCIVSDQIPPGLLLDRERIKQILTNLLSNAIKFTKSGAVKLEVSAQPTEQEPKRVDLTFCITDTGTGIQADDLSVVFNPFEQRNHNSGNTEGTGLGLAICKRLCEIMGGDISLTSKHLVGSEFTVNLPAIKRVSLEEDVSTGLKFLPVRVFDAAKILIVDDDQTNRLVLHGFLEFYSFLQIFEAADGVTGIEQAKQVNPDVILMDMKMPNMGGLEATQKIRTLPGLDNIPVIAVTAKVLQEDRKEILETCDGYLPKPVDANALFIELSEFLVHYRPTELLEAVSQGQFKTLSAEELAQLKAELGQRIGPKLSAQSSPSHAQARRLLSELAVLSGRFREEGLMRWFAALVGHLEGLNLSGFQKELKLFDQLLASLDQK
ncbi:MAG: chemotaxis protein CheB [bacterium]|nr:chemotaxis protein CheB [bacterium]